MFSSKARDRRHSLDIWPGFVDALAALLLVIIFVLVTFILAQYFLTDALHSRDLALTQMSDERAEALQKMRSFQDVITDLDTQVIALRNQLSHTKQTEEQERAAKLQTMSKASSLSQQVQELVSQIDSLNNALKTQEEKYKGEILKVEGLSKRLDDSLHSKIEELKALTLQLNLSQDENSALKKRLTSSETSFAQYRSEFFAKLKETIGNRPDMRIVGDRFVFQSEVLFDLASDQLGVQGQQQLDSLVKALKEITKVIPDSVPWILRVDGHTDRLPIKTSQFQSNWELSSGRAISVVKYLISQGISPSRLVAAGFGEHQPLVESGESRAAPRNRRIEFKLDHR
jgi:chemotaxis protein MotB